MLKFVSALLLGAFALASAAPPAIEADARRGAEFFEQNKCTTCHGPGTPRDLTRRLDRDYTPAALAARLWNHAPTMWAEMRKDGIKPPAMSDQQAADLFAFFYSRRYFERPGDAGRGKRVFTEKGCAGCHSMTAEGTGPAVSTWGSLTDPVALIGAMWNHAPKMQAAIAKKGGKWPEMTNQDMSDLLLYLQTQPANRARAAEFLLPPIDSGKELFAERCGGCHKGTAGLENKLKDETLTGVAVAMWNHAPMMRQSAAPISPDDMRRIIGFAWASQFLQPHGKPDHGKHVFESHKCASCHGDASTGSPSLAGLAKPFTTMNMVSVLWSHGPKMLDRMAGKGIQWPALTPAEMSDLAAYLNR
jgi:mono/diheme cytochrome c family protein